MKNREIPSREENPQGLHSRYYIEKLVPIPEELRSSSFTASTYMTEPVDDNAEYFVLRLDEGCSDDHHFRACRIAIHAYANAIEKHIPQLAADLRQRYPLGNYW